MRSTEESEVLSKELLQPRAVKRLSTSSFRLFSNNPGMKRSSLLVDVGRIASRPELSGVMSRDFYGLKSVEQDNVNTVKSR